MHVPICMVIPINQRKKINPKFKHLNHIILHRFLHISDHFYIPPNKFRPMHNHMEPSLLQMDTDCVNHILHFGLLSRTNMCLLYIVYATYIIVLWLQRLEGNSMHFRYSIPVELCKYPCFLTHIETQNTKYTYSTCNNSV